MKTFWHCEKNLDILFKAKVMSLIAVSFLIFYFIVFLLFNILKNFSEIFSKIKKYITLYKMTNMTF